MPRYGVSKNSIGCKDNEKKLNYAIYRSRNLQSGGNGYYPMYFIRWQQSIPNRQQHTKVYSPSNLGLDRTSWKGASLLVLGVCLWMCAKIWHVRPFFPYLLPDSPNLRPVKGDRPSWIKRLEVPCFTCYPAVEQRQCRLAGAQCLARQRQGRH